MNMKQVFLCCFLGVILAQIVFYEHLSTAFDAWRMQGCEHVKDIPIYELEVNPVTGDLWGISNDGLFQFDGTEWHTHTIASLQEGYVIDAFIVFDSQGRMWQGGWHGVGVFDGQTWKFYNQQDWGLPNMIVTSIAFDPTGKPWVGLSSNGSSPEGTCGGVSILDGERWFTYYFSDVSFLGTGCQNVQSIQFDPDGKAWLGLSSGVLMILEKAQDETFQNALPGGPEFSSSFKSTGYFLILDGSLPGESDQSPVVITDFLARSHTNQLTLDGRILDPIRSVLFDKGGNVWINAGDTLYQYKEDKVSFVHSPATRSVMDLQGNVWSVGGEVSMYDGKFWKTYHVGNSCIGNEDVKAIAFDMNNRAWIARFPFVGRGEISLNTFDDPPRRVPDILLRLRTIFLPAPNPWFRWVGPILLGSVWLLIALGAKWPAFTFPLLNLILALASERVFHGQYHSIFVFELITLFSLGGGWISVLLKRQQEKVGFWKNAAPGFYGTLVGISFVIIAGLLWNLFFGGS